ncbi:baseplate hub subunit and tail lysozyme [Vibrio phage EniLVp02]
MIMGFNGFVWWQGVVENRDDPLKLGRCQVRVLGIDSERKALDRDRGIPTDMLRWMHPMQPITEAAMNGIGRSPTGLVNGTWVFGFFRDGDNCQDGVMMGTVGGIPQQVADPSEGFNDPDGVYPKADHIGEPDTNRLARNENIDKTVVKTKRDDVETNVQTRLHSWNEPPTPYNTRYPYNKVTESESGHITEVDDTPGAERLHTMHRTGTFEEIHPDGSRVTKIVGDDFEIVKKDKNLYVKGALQITVDGFADIKVADHANILVEKTTTLESLGHVEVKCPTANLGHEYKEPAVLGDHYKEQIDHLIEVFNNHTHFGNLGIPTSVPTVLGHIQIYKEARSSTVNIRGPIK